jgi:hypothetical protein
MPANPYEPPKRLAKIVEGYTQGTYTALELQGMVLEFITAENAKAVLAILPVEVLEELAKTIKESPETEDEWSRVRLISLREGALSTAKYRSAIEILRRNLPFSPVP